MQVGAGCSLATCKMMDFLPFTCDACALPFCLDHRTYDKHQCPKAGDKDCRVFICPVCTNGIKINPEEDINVTWERHSRSPECKKKVPAPKCPVVGCKEKLTDLNSVVCPYCKKKFCLTHRFEDLHNCDKGPKAKARAKAAEEAKAKAKAQEPVDDTRARVLAAFPHLKGVLNKKKK